MDKYNEAIKRKLESIEPEFREQDWNEMQSFMAINASKGNVLGRTVLYLAGVILLCTSLFFNFKQNNDNKILLKTNELLTQKNNIKNTSGTKIIHQKDTVYLTKYIVKWRTVERIVYVENSKNKIVSSENSITQRHPPTTATPVSLPPSKGDFSDDTNKFRSNSFQISESNNTLANKKISDDKPLTISILNSISAIKNLFVWNKKMSEINFKSTIPLQDKRKQITIKLPSFDNLKYRVGVSLDLANDQNGGGVLSEILLNKNWSVNAGLRFMNIAGQSYYTAEQYQFDTKQNFRQQYAPYVPANFDLINIDFQHYLLQMPIGITYRYPLRKDFTLLLSATTDLDLFVKQYINFDYKKDNSNFIEATHKSIISKKVLNNIEFSAGLEKKYQRMIFQVNPFFSVQLKNVDYKKENYFFGAKMRFFVNVR